MTTASPQPTFRQALDETEPLIGVVTVYGPPAILLLGPWVFLALLLAPPFAVLVTLVLLVVAAAAVVALIGAILASPYLLVRHVRGRFAGRAPMRAPVAPVAPVARLVAGQSR